MQRHAAREHIPTGRANSAEFKNVKLSKVSCKVGNHE
jgi:hypothetical protein